MEHPKLKDFRFDRCLYVFVAKVNPKTRKVDDNEVKNTEMEVWLEFGFPEYDRNVKQMVTTHDIRFDCGAPTFEEAIVKLANLVQKHEKPKD